MLYINDGSGKLARATDGHFISDGGRSRDLTCADIDNDGDLDIMVANQNNEKNFIYVNDGAALFQRVLTGDFVNDADISYSVDAVDIDDDGDVQG